ncbi:putative BolA protein [Dioscorea sansibarensis]
MRAPQALMLRSYSPIAAFFWRPSTSLRPVVSSRFANSIASSSFQGFLNPIRFSPSTKLDLKSVSLSGSGQGCEVSPTRRLCSVRASPVSDSGSIDMPLMQSMEKKIKEHLNADLVTVKDAYGDGRHVSIDVISTAFEGQSPVNRQRMVYKAIWEELQSTVHAVDQMTTRTPAEAAENQ